MGFIEAIADPAVGLTILGILFAIGLGFWLYICSKY